MGAGASAGAGASFSIGGGGLEDVAVETSLVALRELDESATRVGTRAAQLEQAMAISDHHALELFRALLGPSASASGPGPGAFTSGGSPVPLDASSWSEADCEALYVWLRNRLALRTQLLVRASLFPYGHSLFVHLFVSFNLFTVF